MSKVIDYAFKCEVLKNHSDLLIKHKRAHLLSYAKSNYLENGVYSKVLDMPKKYNQDMSTLREYCLQNNLINVLNECSKINQASYKRVQRLRERISCMLTAGDCIFITLTFNDNTLNNTDAKNRRVFVSRYLKTFKCKYVANVDYGLRNHREHYHALIQSSLIDLSLWRKYGNINVERIRLGDNYTNVKLAKYISKLSNHAIKETTKRSCLIYSR